MDVIIVIEMFEQRCHGQLKFFTSPITRAIVSAPECNLAGLRFELQILHMQKCPFCIKHSRYIACWRWWKLSWCWWRVSEVYLPHIARKWSAVGSCNQLKRIQSKVAMDSSLERPSSPKTLVRLCALIAETISLLFGRVFAYYGYWSLHPQELRLHQIYE